MLVRLHVNSQQKIIYYYLLVILQGIEQHHHQCHLATFEVRVKVPDDGL